MEPASRPHSDNKDGDADHAELTELVTTQEIQEGELR